MLHIHFEVLSSDDDMKIDWLRLLSSLWNVIQFIAVISLTATCARDTTAPGAWIQIVPVVAAFV